MASLAPGIIQQSLKWLTEPFQPDPCILLWLQCSSFLLLHSILGLLDSARLSPLLVLVRAVTSHLIISCHVFLNTSQSFFSGIALEVMLFMYFRNVYLLTMLPILFSFSYHSVTVFFVLLIACFLLYIVSTQRERPHLSCSPFQISLIAQSLRYYLLNRHFIFVNSLPGCLLSFTYTR